MSNKAESQKKNNNDDAKQVDVKKNRNLAFDIIRIIAIMFVLYNHHKIAFTYYNYVTVLYGFGRSAAW